MTNKKVITINWKDKDYLNLNDYVVQGGFSLLKDALNNKFHPYDFIEEIENSGLRGRGGGGFLTGKKWRMVREYIEKSKNPVLPAKARGYLICNADESEPGTYKDRLIIEKSPILLIEGIILAAWATGAEEGIIYLNGIYKLAEFILKKEIAFLEKENLLGKNILGSNFSFNLSVFSGAGSYVCGEESALINTISGNRGEPTMKPPYPIEKGLFGRPTLVNNVETLSLVPFILQSGASAFRLRGKSESSQGTKLFVLNGSVNKPGVYEAPLGTTLRELIYEYANGLPRGKSLKCVQVGGSSGYLYPPKFLDMPLGYDCEREISVGSGAVLVIDESADLKKLLLAWSSFFQRESCGKCVPCREGTYQLHELAKRFSCGKVRDRDRERLEDLIFTMQNASFCPLGSFATNCWSSVMEMFPGEIFSEK